MSSIDLIRYFELLDSVEELPLKRIQTSYLPANARLTSTTFALVFYGLRTVFSCRDAGASEQIITVERLSLPPPAERRRSAQLLDVMEVIKLSRSC